MSGISLNQAAKLAQDKGFGWRAAQKVMNDKSQPKVIRLAAAKLYQLELNQKGNTRVFMEKSL